MNKKLIIGIIAGVVALAVIVVGIILVFGTINGSRPEDADTSSISSAVDKDEQGDSSDDATSSGGVLGNTAIESGVNSAVADDTTLASDVIKVPVEIKKNPGMTMAQIYFEYDQSVLTCVGFENGDILETYIDPAYGDGNVVFIMECAETEDTAETGELLTLLFKAKKNAKAGAYEVKVGEKSQFINIDETFVKPEISIEKATVK